MAKELKFDAESRLAIKKGIDTVAQAVGATLGPKGRCVIITDYSNGKPHITKDGVTVAKNIELRDNFENAGACLIREAALKTVATTGDATTTSTVLASEFINRAEELITAGNNPVIMKFGVEKAQKDVLNYIDTVKQTISDEDISKIARISGNNDPEIGELLGNIYEQIGKDGIIIVEESSGLHTTSEIVSGIKFDRGYEAPHFVTDTIKDQCILENPYILITEHKITNTADLLQILNPIATEHKSLLLIAQDFDESVVENLKLNHLQGILKCCLVKCPSYREYRKSYLQDIAVFVGAKLLTYDSGASLRDITMNDLGSCKKVIIDKDNTTILEGNGFKEAVEYRAAELKEELKRTLENPGMDGSFMEKWLKQRIAALLGGICSIRVGGVTELEMKERKDRIDDAVCATKAAIEDGIVFGGGLTYFNAYKALKDKHSNDVGYNLVIDSLPIIMATIMKNAGITETPQNYLRGKHSTIGFDAVTNEVVNLHKRGIIDAAKAVKEAFKNALSVLLLYLSTTCVIAPEKEITIFN